MPGSPADQPSSFFSSTIAQALGTAPRLVSEYQRGQTLAAIVIHLTQLGHDQHAFDVAPRVPYMDPAVINGSPRADMLSKMALLFSQAGNLEAVQKVFILAREIPHNHYRIKTLVGVAPHLPREQQHEVFQQVLQKLPSLPEEVLMYQELVRIGPHLSQEALERALEVAQTLSRLDYKPLALVDLASYLPPEKQYHVLQQALDETQRLSRDHLKERPLSRISPRFAQLGYPQQALDVAGRISGTYKRGQALVDAAPHLSQEFLERALNIVQKTGDQAESIAKIASYLPPERRREVLEQALESAQNIRGEAPRGFALVGVARHLPKELLGQVLQGIEKISHEPWRAGRLADLAPYLPQHLLEQALEAVKHISLHDARAAALAAVTPYLPESQRAEIVEQALELAETSTDEHIQKKVIVGIAPDLNSELFPRALAVALGISSGTFRPGAIGALVPRLHEFTFSEITPMWEDTMRQSAPRGLAHVLLDIEQLVPVVAHFGGAQGLIQSVVPILAIGRVNEPSRRQERPPARPPRQPGELRVKDLVTHPKFGEGQVLALMGDGEKAKVRVAFEVGEKLLLKRFVTLSGEPLEDSEPPREEKGKESGPDSRQQIERLEGRLVRHRDDTEILWELMRLHLDRGDPRGRLIELDLRLLLASETQRKALLKEKVQLQEEHLEHLIGPLTDMPDVMWEVKWGYLWKVRLPRFSEEWFEPVRVILSHPASRMLEGLSLAYRRPNDFWKHRASFLEHLLCVGLGTLDLTKAFLTPEDACAIARCEALRLLTALILTGNRIGDEGAKAIVSSERLSALATLDLRDNGITDEGAKAIAESTELDALTSLDLSGNRFTAEGAAVLHETAWLQSVKVLSSSPASFVPAQGSTLRAGERVVELDEDGFLQNSEEWDEDVARALARKEGIEEMTDDHWKVVRCIRDNRTETGLPPTMRELCKLSGMKLKRIYELFPSGPKKGAQKVAGLPIGTGPI